VVRSVLAGTSHTTRGWARTLTSNIWEPELGGLRGEANPALSGAVSALVLGTFLPCRAASATWAHLVRLALEEQASARLRAGTICSITQGRRQNSLGLRRYSTDPGRLRKDMAAPKEIGPSRATQGERVELGDCR
jgi:hypothetical protein